MLSAYFATRPSGNPDHTTSPQSPRIDRLISISPRLRPTPDQHISYDPGLRPTRGTCEASCRHRINLFDLLIKYVAIAPGALVAALSVLASQLPVASPMPKHEPNIQTGQSPRSTLRYKIMQMFSSLARRPLVNRPPYVP
jgi:hypothetical protein